MLALSLFAAVVALGIPDKGLKVDVDLPVPPRGMRDPPDLGDRKTRTRRVMVSMLDGSDPESREECVKSIFGHRELASDGCASATDCNNAYVHTEAADASGGSMAGEYTLCVETAGACTEDRTTWEYFCPADGDDATAVLGEDGCEALAASCNTDAAVVRGWSPEEVEKGLALCCVHAGHSNTTCAGVVEAALREYELGDVSYGEDAQFCHGMADLLDLHMKIAVSKGFEPHGAIVGAEAQLEGTAAALMEMDLKALPNLAKQLAVVQASVRKPLPPGLGEDGHIASLLETRAHHQDVALATADKKATALALASQLMGSCDTPSPSAGGPRRRSGSGRSRSRNSGSVTSQVVTNR